jgi:hypothetical protein
MLEACISSFENISVGLYGRSNIISMWVKRAC